MPEINLFIAEDELLNVIDSLASNFSLKVYYRSGDYYQAIEDRQLNSNAGFSAIPNSIFLVPNNQSALTKIFANDVIPRNMGWMHVICGRRENSKDDEILTMTSIRGENSRTLAVKTGNWLRQWKNKNVLNIAYGVKGVNVAFGGSDTYNNIGYTHHALNMIKAGVKWKQFIDGNVVFFPNEM